MPTLADTLTHPVAIAMWDFSWLERRWPGAGYADWDRALDELAERGYDAVRIDAYPHLVALDPHRTWELVPCWTTQDWGSPARLGVRVLPELIEFITRAAARGIRVALSTWFREDTRLSRLNIASPGHHAEIWAATLDHLAAAGVLDRILYVDLCNEWPLDLWAPFYRRGPQGARDWPHPESLAWMREALGRLRARHPGVPLTFSFTPEGGPYPADGLEGFDLLEPHLWMANCTEFYRHFDYRYERFDLVGYEKIARHAEPLYRADPAYWQGRLTAAIDDLADWSRRCARPLVTTECWAVVDYKDWPGLDWGWVKEVCALGVEHAAASGRWLGIATSNFCGPQFRGMWEDRAWHERLTRLIRSGSYR